MALTGQPEQTDDAVIANDDFFPDLALSDFLKPYQIPNKYSNDTLYLAVEQAMIKINLRLQPFKSAQLAVGHVSLVAYIQQYPEPVGRDDLLMHLYKKAVFCTAKAQVLRQDNGGVAKHQDEQASLRDLTATMQCWLDEADGAVYTFLARFGLQNASTLTGNKKTHIKVI